MKKLILILALGIFVCTPVVANANNAITTTDLYYSLQSMRDPNYQFWQGYVAGAANSYFNFTSVRLKCDFPQGVTVGQEVQITLNYLKNNAKIWELPPDTLIWLAMKEAFPCKVN